jgi:NADH-quinone oxidoreductase subunit C
LAIRDLSLKSSERVEPEAFSERVTQKLGDAVSDVEIRFGQVWAKVAPERVLDAVRPLREDPELACTFFTFLSAVDWQEEGFEVIITLFSLRHLNTVVLKVRLPAEDPQMPSITGVFRGANWHERETAEMFGVEFTDAEGNPLDLDGLLLPEGFEGHPLRKDFVLASRVAKPWPGSKEPGESEHDAAPSRRRTRPPGVPEEWGTDG